MKKKIDCLLRVIVLMYVFFFYFSRVLKFLFPRPLRVEKKNVGPFVYLNGEADSGSEIER